MNMYDSSYFSKKMGDVEKKGGLFKGIMMEERKLTTPLTMSKEERQQFDMFTSKTPAGKTLPKDMNSEIQLLLEKREVAK